MSYTKRQLIEAAYNELALAGYVFDITPEEMQAGLMKLDTMMAAWAAKDMAVGYSFGLPGSSDLDQDSGLPLVAVSGVYLKLAINIAASKGKQLMQSTIKQASDDYSALVSFVARGQVQTQQYRSGLPRGAGQKGWRGYSTPFLPSPDTSPLQAGPGGLEFLGG